MKEVTFSPIHTLYWTQSSLHTHLFFEHPFTHISLLTPLHPPVSHKKPFIQSRPSKSALLHYTSDRPHLSCVYYDLEPYFLTCLPIVGCFALWAQRCWIGMRFLAANFHGRLDDWISVAGKVTSSGIRANVVCLQRE